MANSKLYVMALAQICLHSPQYSSALTPLVLQPFHGLSCALIALLIQGVKFVQIVFKTPHLDRALRPDGQYAALVLESLHQFELGIIYGMELAQQQTQAREASVNVFRNFDEIGRAHV